MRRAALTVTCVALCLAGVSRPTCAYAEDLVAEPMLLQDSPERGSDLEDRQPEQTATRNAGVPWRCVGERLSLRVGGYLMFDWAEISQGSSLDPIAPPAGTGTQVRDFQIDFGGQLSGETQFRLQFDIDNSRAELQDNYLQRDGVPYLGSIRLGHFKEPFGLENSTSLRDLVFMERSLTDVLTPGRGVGVSLGNTACDARIGWNLGAFWDTTGVDKISSSQAFSLMGRLTGIAFCRDDNRELLHVGISLGHRSMNEALRFQARPEMNMAPRYLDTGDFSVNTITLLNLESAYARGPLLLQSECIWAWTSGTMRAENVTLNDIAEEAASRLPKLTEWLQGHGGRERSSDSILWRIPFDLAARGDLSFFGAYVQASYILTGEQRPYVADRGLFGAPVPEHPFRFRGFRGLGAWEVAARWSYLNLSDSYVMGGRETNVTLGLNWHLSKSVKMALNYFHCNIDRDTYDDTVNAVQMRMQIVLKPQGLREYRSLRSGNESGRPTTEAEKNWWR